MNVPHLFGRVAIAAGSAFEDTEIKPSAPASMARAAVGSSPDSTANAGEPFSAASGPLSQARNSRASSVG